ncbi:MAG: DUF5906 domain-containing protein [Sulfurimonas sp.]
MSVDINAKIQAIKESAKQQLTPEADYYNQVQNYIVQVNSIREANKYHNEDKSKALLDSFLSEKQMIEDEYEARKPEMTINEKITKIEDAYVRYARKNAALDRLGQATIFFDAMTGMYVRISRYVDIDTEGKKHDRIITDRLKDTTVNKYIDLESKTLAGIHVATKKRTAILREFKVYRKEFAPLKPAFYGEFFNTYTPNGFLDVRVNNVLNVDKFTTITLPKRYPIINALLENIAPYEDERVFLLNWLSTILNTAKKTKTAIILKGIQRTGKGVFASKIIEYAMHESNCFVATNANLSDNFNSYLEDKLFITFDEVKGDFHKDKDIANKIKLIVSEENISIRTMHTNPYMIRFSANCIFLSNEDLPIPMDQSDERLSVIETKSKTLLQVARGMGYEIGEFISLLEKERDEFLVHLKMCNYSKQLAMSTIANKTKKAIQDATSTTQSVLKTAFRSQDLDTISEMLDEAIADTKAETLIKQEIEASASGDYETIKSKKIIPFPYNNAEMKIIFMDEFKSGLISNTSLKWFSKVTNIEHILKSDTKFGNFWNLVLSKASIIKLRWSENRHIDGTTQLIEVEHGERFRAINQHELPTTFHFNKKTFTFTSSKIAIEIQREVF